MIYVGIDLAWTYKNETGLCIIDKDGRVVYLESKVFTDEEILHIIKIHAETSIAVAIDAPLIIKNEAGSRPAEGLMMRDRINGHKLKAFAVSRGYLKRSYNCIRGEVLSKLIKDSFEDIIIGNFESENKSVILESFPSGICAGLFSDIYPIKYKIKSKIPFEETKEELKRLIERVSYEIDSEKNIKDFISKINITSLDISKKDYKHIEDKIDAFLCSYGLFLISKNFAEQRVYGDCENGCIVLPVRKG